MRLRTSSWMRALLALEVEEGDAAGRDRHGGAGLGDHQRYTPFFLSASASTARRSPADRLGDEQRGEARFAVDERPAARARTASRKESISSARLSLGGNGDLVALPLPSPRERHRRARRRDRPEQAVALRRRRSTALGPLRNAARIEDGRWRRSRRGGWRGTTSLVGARTAAPTASTETTGEPASARARSISWIIRSSTTSTSTALPFHGAMRVEFQHARAAHGGGELAEHRRETLDMADLQHDAARRRRGRRDRARPRRRVGDRLLDQHMDAGIDQVAGDLVMQRGRHGDRKRHRPCRSGRGGR